MSAESKSYTRDAITAKFEQHLLSQGRIEREPFSYLTSDRQREEYCSGERGLVVPPRA
jgi:hypothetical protein